MVTTTAGVSNSNCLLSNPHQACCPTAAVAMVASSNGSVMGLKRHFGVLSSRKARQASDPLEDRLHLLQKRSCWQPVPLTALEMTFHSIQPSISRHCLLRSSETYYDNGEPLQRTSTDRHKASGTLHACVIRNCTTRSFLETSSVELKYSQNCDSLLR